jgi:hypothetical protein
MKSPLNGTEVRLLNKGETANPRGGSLKARARAALAASLGDPDLKAAFTRLARIAADAEDDNDAVAAIRLITDVTGLKVADIEKVVVENSVTLLDRRDGTPVSPMRASATAKGNARILGSGANP